MSCTETLVWILFHGYRLNWIPSLTIRQYLVFNFKWGSFSPYVKVQTPTHCQTPVFYESYHLPPTPMCDYYLLPFIWCGWCALKRPINQLISKKIAAADLSLTSAPTRREETGIERGVRASPLRVWLRGGIKVLSLSLSPTVEPAFIWRITLRQLHTFMAVSSSVAHLRLDVLPTFPTIKQD